MREQTKVCTKIVNCKNEENIRTEKGENKDKEINTVFSQDKYTEYSNNFSKVYFHLIKTHPFNKKIII